MTAGGVLLGEGEGFGADVDVGSQAADVLVAAQRHQHRSRPTACSEAAATTPDGVLDAIGLMLDDCEPISFAALARTARVSAWPVYAEGVREHVQAAIQRQESGSRDRDWRNPT